MEKKEIRWHFLFSPTGNRSVQQGAFLLQEKFPGDIPEIDPLEYGSDGEPPISTYPQIE